MRHQPAIDRFAIRQRQNAGELVRVADQLPFFQPGTVHEIVVLDAGKGQGVVVGLMLGLVGGVGQHGFQALEALQARRDLAQPGGVHIR